jgi:hypothetical protein
VPRAVRRTSAPNPSGKKAGLAKIVSGGQTGVDRAALDAALAAGMACGGWCPRGRRAEDGEIPGIYPLTETVAKAYGARTRRNVEDSDGTLVLAWGGAPTGGTRLAVTHARRVGKPHLVVDLDRPSLAAIARWLAGRGIRVVNVAGPRESSRPGSYAAARALMDELVSASAARPIRRRS